jgi:hypothetical protein
MLAFNHNRRYKQGGFTESAPQKHKTCVRCTIIGVLLVRVYTRACFCLQNGSERCLSHSATRGKSGFPSICIQIQLQRLAGVIWEILP